MAIYEKRKSEIYMVIVKILCTAIRFNKIEVINSLSRGGEKFSLQFFKWDKFQGAPSQDPLTRSSLSFSK